jgi:hypothetical protein
MKNFLVNGYKAILFLLTLAFTLPMVHNVTGSWLIAILFSIINEGNLIFWPYIAGKSKTMSEFKLCSLMTIVAISSISIGVVIHILDSQGVLETKSVTMYANYFLVGTILVNLCAMQYHQLINPETKDKINDLQLQQEVIESAGSVDRDIKKRQQMYEVFQSAKQNSRQGYDSFMEDQQLVLPPTAKQRFTSNQPHSQNDQLENPALAIGRSGSGRKKIYKAPKKK